MANERTNTERMRTPLPTSRSGSGTDANKRLGAESINLTTTGPPPRRVGGQLADGSPCDTPSFHVGLACAAPPAPAPFVVSRHAAEVGERHCGRRRVDADPHPQAGITISPSWQV